MIAAVVVVAGGVVTAGAEVATGLVIIGVEGVIDAVLELQPIRMNEPISKTMIEMKIFLTDLLLFSIRV